MTLHSHKAVSYTHLSEDILNALGQLKAGRVNYKILFLDARNDVLERRYKETRRRHPISIASKVSTDEAILQEREILAPLYEMADYKIDTSLFSTAQLKDLSLIHISSNASIWCAAFS